MRLDVGRGSAAFVACGSIATLLAGASLIVVLTLGAPGQALAACGATHLSTGGGEGGVHTASGAGGVHTGLSAPHASSGSSGCPNVVSGNGIHAPTATSSIGHVDLAGVHTSTRNSGSGTHTHFASALTGAHVRRH
jgi:hypothetical protein